jgi:hypothetical protein
MKEAWCPWGSLAWGLCCRGIVSLSFFSLGTEWRRHCVPGVLELETGRWRRCVPGVLLGLDWAVQLTTHPHPISMLKWVVLFFFSPIRLRVVHEGKITITLLHLRRGTTTKLSAERSGVRIPVSTIDTSLTERRWCSPTGKVLTYLPTGQLPDFFPGIKRSGCEVNLSPPPTARLSMSGAIPLLPPYAWRGTRKL